MKTTLTIFAFVIGLVSTSFSQQTPMVKGKSIVMAGIGFGGYGADVSSSVSPTLSATFMHGLKENFGPGNLSVGGTIAYKKGTFDFAYSDSDWNYFAFAGRASYHPHFVNSSQWDVYGGLGIGYYSVSTSYQSEFYAGDFSASEVALTIHLGGRYEINEKWSVWAEIGNELSVLSIGAGYTIK